MQAVHTLSTPIPTLFRGDFIMVGDLMRSVSLLVYKPEEETLELRAQV